MYTRIILTFFIAGLLSSCAVHSGNISSGPSIDCPLKSIVTGESHTRKILGIGGLDKQALILEAKQDLYSKYQGNRNLKLNNFSVDFKTTFLILYMSTKVTVSADLYDCDSAAGSSASNGPPLIDGLTAGDSIIYQHDHFYHGQVLNLSANGKCMITYKLSDRKLKNQTVSLEHLFKTSKHPDNRNYFGYEVGETGYVEVLILKSNKKVVKPCSIVGLNKKYLLISYTTDEGKERMISVEKHLVKK